MTSHHTAVNVTDGSLSGNEKTDAADIVPVDMAQQTTYFAAPKTYQNGSTEEIVCADTARKLKIGALNPWERCECLGIIDGMYIVRYQVDGTTADKVGIVVYDGGVN